MSVLKLKPSCKDYLWGGRRLIEEYGKTYDGDVLAETWELSCHPDGPSRIINGKYAGKTLQEYIDMEGREVLGTHCRRFRDFPILTKFIDAKDNLSIQVHPDNRYALKNEGSMERRRCGMSWMQEKKHFYTTDLNGKSVWKSLPEE